MWAELKRALTDSGWSAEGVSEQKTQADDLLQELIRTWHAGAPDWLTDLSQAGWTLRLLGVRDADRCTAHLLLQSPRVEHSGPATAFLSSGLPTSDAARRAWFVRFRQMCLGLPRDAWLLSAAGTAAANATAGAARLWGFPHRTIKCPRRSWTLTEWLKRLRNRRLIPDHWYASPAVAGCAPTARTLPDSVLAAAAERNCVVGIRPGGRLDRAFPGVRENLSGFASTFTSCRSAMTIEIDGLTPRGSSTVPQPLAGGGGALSESVWDNLTGAGWLSHWTRGCGGPWPDESEREYWEAELEMRSGPRHDALGSLMRIVRQQRLLAQSAAIRGGYPVVCLTEVPLKRHLQHRRFQRHRHRWDFTGFGIAIRRQALSALGARPVIYSDSDNWLSLSDDERPYYQKRSNGCVDFGHEREWRIEGDVDLRTFEADDVVVFVPDRGHAAELSELSRWPVLGLKDRTILAAGTAMIGSRKSRIRLPDDRSAGHSAVPAVGASAHSSRTE